MEAKTKIKAPENIFGLGEDEKLKTELWYSPKKGLTFVKVYNPYTSKGLYLATNNRTKYVCFDCRFYKAPNLPETFEVFKTHVLELPVYTAFQKLKALIKSHQIMENIPIYLVIQRTGKYKFDIKRLTSDDFFFALNNNQHYKNLPAYTEELKVTEEKIE